MDVEVAVEQKPEEVQVSVQADAVSEEKVDELPPVITEQNFIDSSDDECPKSEAQDCPQALSPSYKNTDTLRLMTQTWQQRHSSLSQSLKYFHFHTPRALAATPTFYPSLVS